MWPFKKTTPATTVRLSWFDEHERSQAGVDAKQRAQGKPLNYRIAVSGIETDAFLDRKTWMWVTADGRVVHHNRDNVKRVALIHRDEALYKSIMHLLDAMLKSRRTKFIWVNRGMGSRVPAIATMTDYGEEGPSIICEWDLLRVSHDGPAIEISPLERAEIEGRMKDHGKNNYVLDHTKMYDLL